MNTTNTKPAQKSAIEAAIDGSRLTLSFINGKSLVVDAANLSQDILTAATMHGLKQKLVDAAAISRDPETGRAATIETKYDAIKEVLERLLSGEWNKRREGGGSTGGLLKRALVEMYDGRKSAEEIQAYLDGKDDKAKAALRKNPKVATIIDRLRAEDAKESGVEPGADLLAELEGDM